MQTRDKWIIATLILVMSATGMSYYGFAHNDTQVQEVQAQPTIVVNGNGSSGTGDVQNVQQVTQVTQVSGGTGSSSSKTTAPTVTQSVTGTNYVPEQ